MGECDDWNRSVPGYWHTARIHGATLNATINAVQNASDMLLPGDWAPIAQTPALYGAVGFDSAGVIDNSEWECENTTQICEVHPKCARIAAQMIQYPFAGDKKYASSWSDKISTYTDVAETGFLSKFNSFKFDSDGYHGYCHSPGEGYCWSYTACLREMMKWLCSQSETAEHCCPSLEVRDACQNDVNSKECNVCLSIEDKGDFEEDRQVIMQGRELTSDSEVMDFLHPDATDLALYAEEEQQKHAQLTCEICEQLSVASVKAWAFIDMDVCGANRELCAAMCGYSMDLENIDEWEPCNEEVLVKQCGQCS